MKKMFGVVVVLLIMYIAFQVVYSYTVGRRINSYKISTDGIDYEVKETYIARHKTSGHSATDKNNYYYEIKSNDKIIFSFKLVGNYTGVEKFIKELKIYKNNDLICAYPVFKDKTESLDVLCNNGDKYYLYGTAKGQDAGLDAFVTNLKVLGYVHPSWDAANLEIKKVGAFELYSKNISEDQNLTIWQYKGFYRMTSRGENYFSLNTSDQYEATLTTMVNQYYVIPDYKETYKFTRMFVTNLISGSMDTLDLGVTIPYDSFIQGVADNKIYIVDRGNKIQYTIDIYSKETKVVGDIYNSTKYYNNGKWETKSIYDVIDNALVFKTEPVIPDNLKALNPVFVGEVGGETDGYFYLYIQENGGVSVYRVDKQNTTILTLIFKVPSINSIKYVASDIYFISNDTLYTYRNNLGLRSLVKYSEFVFNKSNLYNVYINE